MECHLANHVFAEHNFSKCHSAMCHSPECRGADIKGCLSSSFSLKKTISHFLNHLWKIISSFQKKN
jgi:hypothetical protein